MEELIFEGAYLRTEIYVSKLVGLASQLDGNVPFLLCFTLHLRVIFQLQALRGKGWGGGGGANIWRDDLMKGFFAFPLW